MNRALRVKFSTRTVSPDGIHIPNSDKANDVGPGSYFARQNFSVLPVIYSKCLIDINNQQGILSKST